MVEKTLHIYTSLTSKIAIVASLMTTLLFCGEFARIELTLREQNTRMNQLEDKVTSTMNNNMNVAHKVDDRHYKRHFKEEQEDKQEDTQQILGRNKRQISIEVNQTKLKQSDELRKLIHQEVGKAVSTLQVAKYWIPIPGPPGPPGKPGDKGQKGNRGVKGKHGDNGQKGNAGAKGRRGKRGPRGFKGDPGKNGTPGPRGMPGIKGDPGPSLQSPSVLISPSYVNVNESQSAILHCSASGYPQPVVAWSKNNGLLTNNRSVVDSNGRLEIKHVISDDAGLYQCKASNILGKAQNTATLEVNFRPRLTLKTDVIYKKIGDDVTLPKCNATGHPKPKVMWSKAIGSLPNSRTLIKDGQLTLLNSKKDDAGTYVCKAENRLGSAMLGIMVNVIQLPVFVIKPPSTHRANLGKTVILNCTANGDPKPVISWRKENGVLPYGRYEVKDGILIIRNSMKSDSGVFVCTARSTEVSHAETKITLNIRDPKDCSELYKSGERRNGVYTVKPDDQAAFQVYCDMTTEGGGWTVIQRRKDGSVDFYRNWQQYKTGFGDMNGEFWLGNGYIHRLTARTSSSLHVDLEDWGGIRKYAKYGSFSVGQESDKYRLSVGSYSGTAGDSLKYQNNMAFSTKDRENDVDGSRNCAVQYTGAWWYKDCYESNLNGKYLGNKGGAKGTIWYYFHSNHISMKTAEMKIRPQTF